jgi:ribosomal protein S18 acetylase RimI-like enzyme
LFAHDCAIFGSPWRNFFAPNSAELGALFSISRTSMSYRITRDDTADDKAALDLIDSGIGDYNDDAEPRLADVQHLSCIARDAAGSVIGGAVGRTWGDNAELQQIWLPESQRKSGLGRRILSEFESAARNRGCNLVYLETWTFQARGFYEKNGYHVALEIVGYAPGLSKFTMMKRLA